MVVRNFAVNVGVRPRTDGPSDVVVGMEIDNNLKANGIVKALLGNLSILSVTKPCILVRPGVLHIFMKL